MRIIWVLMPWVLIVLDIGTSVLWIISNNAMMPRRGGQVSNVGLQATLGRRSSPSTNLYRWLLQLWVQWKWWTGAPREAPRGPAARPEKLGEIHLQNQGHINQVVRPTCAPALARLGDPAGSWRENPLTLLDWYLVRTNQAANENCKDWRKSKNYTVTWWVGDTPCH